MISIEKKTIIESTFQNHFSGLTFLINLFSDIDGIKIMESLARFTLCTWFGRE